MSKKDKTFVATIYGYDTMNHEKYHCSVDYFIDNYKEIAKDDFFFVFHSKEDRDSFAFDSYYDEIIIDGDYYPPPHPDYNGAYNPVATKDAKDYLSGLIDINLNVAELVS